MRDFKKILAWQKADDLVVAVYKAIESFPPAERFGLTSQMRRAVVSVAANIAEGSGRETLLDFRLLQGLINSINDQISKSRRTN